MKINQLFYLPMLLMAILSLGSTQAEEEKSVGSVGNGLNAIDSCQANYATEGQLDIPCVNVSGVSYAVKLQPIAPDKTQFTLTSVTPNPVVVNSACVSTYSDLTGKLDIPCLKMVDTSNRLILQADNPSNPSTFRKVTGERRTDSRGQFASTATSITGMYYPTNTKDRGEYLGWLEPNDNQPFYGACHLAVDIKAREDDSVYSIWSGTVRYASMNVSSFATDAEGNITKGGAIVIEHQAADGSKFYALYGHLKNLAVGKGDEVTAHQFIADIGPWYDMSHLHFGINTNTNASDDTLLKGYTIDSSCSDDRGFVEPFGFIESTTGFGSPITISPITYFDGAGSLISPTQSSSIRGGYGANKDTARMQPHDDTGRLSTVVFQFKRDNSCDHIDISSKNIKTATIQVKYWDADKVAKAFTGELPMSVPNLGNYTVVAVTSTEPLQDRPDVSYDVDAICRTSGDAKKGSGTDLDTNIWGDITLDKGYFWTGTGSIISALGTSYGKSKDEVPTPNSHKSLSSFQWYPSSGCEKLRIVPKTVSGGDESTEVSIEFSGDEGVGLKSWASSTWGEATCPGLPCTISANSGNYYVIKVKIDEQHAKESEFLEARCVQ